MEGISETLSVELQEDTGLVRFNFCGVWVETYMTASDCQNAADIFEMFSRDLMRGEA
jgi:hypothetical protein